MTLITVFGGTGFLGRRIVERLTREGATIRVAVRHADRIETLAKSAGIGRTIPIAADVRDLSTVAAAIAGAESVVNAVSAYVEKGGVTYTAVHVHGAGNIATACQQQNVRPTGPYFRHGRRSCVPIPLYPSTRPWRIRRPESVPTCNDPASKRHVRRRWGIPQHPGKNGSINPDHSVDWRWPHEVAARPCKRCRRGGIPVVAK